MTSLFNARAFSIHIGKSKCFVWIAYGLALAVSFILSLVSLAEGFFFCIWTIFQFIQHCLINSSLNLKLMEFPHSGAVFNSTERRKTKKRKENPMWPSSINAYKLREVQLSFGFTNNKPIYHSMFFFPRSFSVVFFFFHCHKNYFPILTNWATYSV